jgi:hypothetical protein
MKNSKTVLFTIVTIAFATLLSGCKTTHHATHSTSSGKLSKEMVGTWVFVGTPGNVRTPPAKGGRYKSRTGTHWSITAAAADTGLVTEHFGGSYQINGDEYIETQHFADNTWLHDNGKSWTFKVKIDGDLMTQLGVGNPYTEVWQRVR